MKKLRITTVVLLLVTAVFFNIERLDIDKQSVANLSSFVYVLGFGCVLGVICISALWRARVGTAVLIWIALYAFVRLFLSGVVHASSPNAYIMITEITLPSVVILVAHRLARLIYDFEQAVESVVLDGMSRRLQYLDEAMDEVQKQLRLSRRSDRPLSVVLIEFETKPPGSRLAGALHDIEIAIAGRQALISLSKCLDRTLRRSDMMMQMRGSSRMVLVCPETGKPGAHLLTKRVRQSAELLDLRVSCGAACFPDDAVTFELLLESAEARLHEPELAVHKSEETPAAAAAVNH